MSGPVERPVERLWAAIQARDWEAATRELAEDLVVDWPATGERFHGPERYVELQRIYPEGWSIEVRTVVREGDRVAAEIRVPHGTRCTSAPPSTSSPAV